MCTWTEDPQPDMAGTWATTCGNLFVLTAGDPKENGFGWCPYCGDPLEIKTPTPSEN